MCETESSSSINLDEELEKAVWTNGGPLAGKPPQLSTIISPQTTANTISRNGIIRKNHIMCLETEKSNKD